jgi:hypothetical protein
VGKRLDKSGNANHATQSVSSKRPTYRDVDGVQWLEFDGIDDFLNTASVDFSGTDKMSVFARVRKPNDSGTAPIVMNGDSGAQNGVFAIYAPHANSSRKWAWSLGGPNVGTSQTFLSVNTLPAPSTATMVGLFDKAASGATNRITPRLNGVLQTSFSTEITGDGSANFRNDKIYIGVQNTTNDFFEGQMYGIVVRGATSSAQEVTDTEEYLTALTVPVLQLLTLIPATQQTKTKMLTVSKSQSLALATAQQLTKVGLLSLPQSIEVISLQAEQVSQSQLIDIDSAQAISMVFAEQITLTELIRLSQSRDLKGLMLVDITGVYSLNEINKTTYTLEEI